MHFWLALFEMGTDKIYAQTYGHDYYYYYYYYYYY
jgi:hypothetical protein